MRILISIFTTNWSKVKTSIAFVGFGLTVIACDNNEPLFIEPGTRPIEPNEIALTLPITTVYFDSLRTDNITDAVIGAHVFEEVGQVTARLYTEFDLDLQDIPFGRIDIDEPANDLTLRYDSVTVRLRLNNFVTNALDPELKLIFRELEDTIFSSALYLADRKLNTGAQVGADSVSVNRVTDPGQDTIFLDFRLNDEYGESIYDRIITNPTGNNSSGTFLDSLRNGDFSFPGLAMEPVDLDGLYNINLRAVIDASLGTDSGTRLRIHVSYEERPDSIVQPIDFTLASDRHYTQVDRDRSGTAFATLTDGATVVPTSGLNYLAPLAGLAPKVSLQPLIDLFDSLGNSIILRRALIRVTAANEQNPVELIRYFFAKTQGGVVEVDWAGVVENAALAAILDDFDYFGNSPSPLTHSLTEGGYGGSITVFTDGLLQSFLDDELLTEEIVLTSPFSTDLGVAPFGADQIKVEIIYLRQTE